MTTMLTLSPHLKLLLVVGTLLPVVQASHYKSSTRCAFISPQSSSQASRRPSEIRAPTVTTNEEADPRAATSSAPRWRHSRLQYQDTSQDGAVRNDLSNVHEFVFSKDPGWYRTYVIDTLGSDFVQESFEINVPDDLGLHIDEHTKRAAEELQQIASATIPDKLGSQQSSQLSSAEQKAVVEASTELLTADSSTATETPSEVSGKTAVPTSQNVTENATSPSGAASTSSILSSGSTPMKVDLPEKVAELEVQDSIILPSQKKKDSPADTAKDENMQHKSDVSSASPTKSAKMGSVSDLFSVVRKELAAEVQSGIKAQDSKSNEVFPDISLGDASKILDAAKTTEELEEFLADLKNQRKETKTILETVDEVDDSTPGEEASSRSDLKDYLVLKEMIDSKASDDKKDITEAVVASEDTTIIEENVKVTPKINEPTEEKEQQALASMAKNNSAERRRKSGSSKPASAESSTSTIPTTTDVLLTSETNVVSAPKATTAKKAFQQSPQTIQADQLLSKAPDQSAMKTVLYVDIGDRLQSIPLGQLTKLGYRPDDLTELECDAIAVIVKDQISCPRSGVPFQWKVPREERESLYEERRVRIVANDQVEQLEEEYDEFLQEIARKKGKKLPTRSKQNKESDAGDDDGGRNENRKTASSLRDGVDEDEDTMALRKQRTKESAMKDLQEVDRSNPDKVRADPSSDSVPSRPSSLTDTEDRQPPADRRRQQRTRPERSNTNADGSPKRLYTGRKQPVNRNDDDDDDRRGARRRRQSPPPKLSNLDPPKPGVFWPDMKSFRNLLRNEEDFRLRFLGSDWADTVQQESRWRSDLYRQWLWTLHNGIGDSVVVPPSRYQRARKEQEEQEQQQQMRQRGRQRRPARDDDDDEPIRMRQPQPRRERASRMPEEFEGERSDPPAQKRRREMHADTRATQINDDDDDAEDIQARPRRQSRRKPEVEEGYDRPQRRRRPRPPPEE